VQRRGWLARSARLLHPSHEHTAFSATVLLMAAVMLSRVLGLVRESFIAWKFGAVAHTDAFYAAFTLPDFMNYLLAGGTASITFVAMLTRYASEKREDEAKKAFSIIISVMSVLLLILIALGTIFTPEFTRWWFKGFTPDDVALCVHLTRILLPVQAFFVVGGVISAVLQWRRQFLYPALTPIIYNLGIIFGGIVFSRWFGIESLAWGALAGAFLGAFLINAIGARRTQIGFRPSFNLRHPAFLEWLRLSIPLMLGVSLVFFDDPFIRHFAAGKAGDISRLNYAKRLFSVPMAVVGQAVGQASLPFFAALFGQKKLREFDGTVSGAVYRASAFSVMMSAWLMAAALPVVDIIYRLLRGRFHFADSQQTATLLFFFAVSLVFWCAQGLYARAYYAAGDTLTPMIAGTIITGLSYPIYGALFHAFGIVGLTLASDTGIAIHTITLAVLLHRKGLVRAGTMPWGELAKAVGTAVFAGALAYRVGHVIPLHGSRLADFACLGLVTVTWAGAALLGLWITKSDLLSTLRRRKQAGGQPSLEQPSLTQQGTQPSADLTI
jgi:putative peptidoglycan lipid II flippase